jgi:hypothetical protein
MLSIFMISPQTDEFGSPILIGLLGLAGLLHQFTRVATRIVGKLEDIDRNLNWVQIRLSDSSVLQLRSALEDDEDCNVLLGKHVIVEVINSFILPPTIFKLSLNEKVES